MGNAAYGRFTGNMALMFNPAQDYDHSDFAKRMGLYSGFATVAQLVPKLVVKDAVHAAGHPQRGKGAVRLGGKGSRQQGESLGA